jgi:regulator of protease activity HflC (stomatin/prohibitin superfamily)
MFRLSTRIPCKRLNNIRTFFRFVDTNATGVKTTFGKAGGISNEDVMLKPGFRVFLPFAQRIFFVSNRLSQSNYRMTVKTKDNVFANLDVNVQWKINPEDSETAFFSLSKPEAQMKSYIENVIRAEVPKIILDNLFTQQGEISREINETLTKRFLKYGYTIVETQITDIRPDEKVMRSMNEINASQRMKEAAKNEADAQYIRRVREAESRAEAKRLQGIGISNMRKAIIDGYSESLKGMSDIEGVEPNDVLDFLLGIQKLETLNEIGTANNDNRVIFTSLDDRDKLRNSVLEADNAGKN